MKDNMDENGKINNSDEPINRKKQNNILKFNSNISINEDSELVEKAKANLVNYLNNVKEVENEVENQTKNMMAFNLMSNVLASQAGIDIVNFSKVEKKKFIKGIIDCIDLFVKETGFNLQS